MAKYYITYNNDDLIHYGVLGQRWGIRRYQNPDGTLTAEGKKKYGKALEKDKEAIEKSKAGLDKKNKLYFGKGFVIKNHRQTGLERRMDKALLRNDTKSYKEMAKVQYKDKSSKEINKMAKERYSRLISDKKSKKIVAIGAAATAATAATIALGALTLKSGHILPLINTGYNAYNNIFGMGGYEASWHYDVIDPATGMPIPQYY